MSPFTTDISEIGASGSIECNLPVRGYEIIKFTPTVAGNYRFESVSDYDTKGYLLGSLTDDFKDLLAFDDDSGEDDNFAIEYELEAGKTYYLSAEPRNLGDGGFDIQVKITHIAEPGRNDYTVTGDLSEEGSSEEIDVVVPVGGMAVIVFTPTADAYYSVSSKSEQYYDTYGKLYSDADLKTVLAENDDCVGLDFCIAYEMTAGTTYYIVVTTYESEDADVTVEVKNEGEDYCFHENVIVSYDCNGTTYTEDEWKGTDEVEGVLGTLPCKTEFECIETCSDCGEEIDRYTMYIEHEIVQNSTYTVGDKSYSSWDELENSYTGDTFIYKYDELCGRCDFAKKGVLFYYGDNEGPYLECESIDTGEVATICIYYYPETEDRIAFVQYSSDKIERYTGVGVIEDEDGNTTGYYFSDGIFDPTFSGTVNRYGDFAEGEEVEVTNGIANICSHEWETVYNYEDTIYSEDEWHEIENRFSCEEILFYAERCKKCEKYKTNSEGSEWNDYVRGHLTTVLYCINGVDYTEDQYSEMEFTGPTVVRSTVTCDRCDIEWIYAFYEFGASDDVEATTYYDGNVNMPSDWGRNPGISVAEYTVGEVTYYTANRLEVDVFGLHNQEYTGIAKTDSECLYFTDGFFDPAFCGYSVLDGELYEVVYGIATLAEGEHVHTKVVTKPGKEATCTEDGLTEESHCVVCGQDISKQEVIKATGHTEVIDEAQVDATCMEDGSTAASHCSVCNEPMKTKEVIPAKGHKVVTDPGKEATCTEDGLTEGSHCSVCNEPLVEQEVIPAKGHKVVTDLGKEATCTEDGLTEGSHCSVCNEPIVEQEVIKATGHTEVTDEEQVDATCTEDGSTAASHCSVCNEPMQTKEVIPAKGHKYSSSYTVDVPATATQAGTKSKHCTVCGVSDPSSITTIPVFGGKWKSSSKGWWYQYSDGSYAKNGIVEIAGVKYAFNASGYVVNGWYAYDGAYYYSTSNGLKSGWVQSGSAWYYMNPSDYKMVTGWKTISGTKYYFKSSGAMATGWQSISGKWYYFESSGKLVTGWKKIGSTWYMFDGSGVMITGWLYNGPTAYYFKSSGAMATGWQSIDGKWYYFASSGAMATKSWVDTNYYVDADGVLVTNAYIQNGTKYYWVDKSGKFYKTYTNPNTTGYKVYVQSTGKLKEN